MKFYVALTAVGVVLAAGVPAAQAQTVITPGVNPSVETIQTTETTRTVRPAPRTARRQVVTTRTVTRQLVPAAQPAIVARSVPVTPQPLYDEVTSAPIATSSDDDYYGRPLYDQVTMPAAAPVMQNEPVVGTQPLAYRYVYEPDRILVIDPTTNIAVQAIPR